MKARTSEVFVSLGEVAGMNSVQTLLLDCADFC